MHFWVETLALCCLASTCLAKPVAIQERAKVARSVVETSPIGDPITSRYKSTTGDDYCPYSSSHGSYLHTKAHAFTNSKAPSTSSIKEPYKNGIATPSTSTTYPTGYRNSSGTAASTLLSDLVSTPAPISGSLMTITLTSTVYATIDCSSSPSNSLPSSSFSPSNSSSAAVSDFASTPGTSLLSQIAATVSDSKPTGTASIIISVSSSTASTSTRTPFTVASPISSSSASTSSVTPSTVNHAISKSVTPTSSVASPSSLPISVQYQEIASSAISVITNTFNNESKVWNDIGGWIAGVVYKDMMDYDHWTGSKSQESVYGAALLEIVTDNNLLKSVGAVDDFNDDQGWWILAFLRAYENYGHVELLNQAIKQWKQIQASSQTSASDAGTAPNLAGITRSNVIPSSCNVHGAVYWDQSPDSTLNAISTGLFAEIGAYLYALTKDESFRQGADTAIGWLRSMMLSNSGIMNIDNIRVTGCVKDLGSLTYNTGVYLSALTSLYQSTGEAQYLEWATLTANSSVTGSFGKNSAEPLVVQQENNIDSHDQSYIWRDVLFRSLNEFFQLLKSENLNPSLQAQIKTFFHANYNQIQQHAKYGNSYSANWFGLMPTGSAWGTASVLSVLTGSMLMF